MWPISTSSRKTGTPKSSTLPALRRKGLSSSQAMQPRCARSPAISRPRPGMIFWGMGISQHIHGTDNSRYLSPCLDDSNVGKPGTGLHPLRGQNNVQGASDAGLIPMFLPDYQSVTDDGVRSAFTEIWGTKDFSNQKGLTVTEMMDAIHADSIKGMYILGENPAMSDPDVAHAREALAKLEHLVVQDIFLTETANYADVILPAAAFYEKTGTVTNTNRQVQLGRAAARPPGQARADWTITTALANRLGLDWSYSDPSDAFAEMKQGMKCSTISPSCWKPALSPIPALPRSGQPIVFGDGSAMDGRARPRLR